MALEADLALHQIHQLTADRESEAGPTEAARQRAVRLCEHLEDRAPIRLRGLAVPIVAMILGAWGFAALVAYFGQIYSGTIVNYSAKETRRVDLLVELKKKFADFPLIQSEDIVLKLA